MAKLVPVYRALTVDDAQRLADFLDDRGVESYVDSTQSPEYGMSQGPEAHVVYVDSHIAEYARQIVRDFSHKWHGGVPKDEVEREETGRENLPGDRPSDDAPSSTNQDRERAYGPDPYEHGDETPRRESPEVEDLIDETGEENFDDRIVGFGVDHDLAEEDDYEAMEREDIDEADSRQGVDEDEARRTDAAHARRRAEYDEEDEG